MGMGEPFLNYDKFHEVGAIAGRGAWVIPEGRMTALNGWHRAAHP